MYIQHTEEILDRMPKELVFEIPNEAGYQAIDYSPDREDLGPLLGEMEIGQELFCTAEALIVRKNLKVYLFPRTPAIDPSVLDKRYPLLEGCHRRKIRVKRENDGYHVYLDHYRGTYRVFPCSDGPVMDEEGNKYDQQDEGFEWIPIVAIHVT